MNEELCINESENAAESGAKEALETAEKLPERSEDQAPEKAAPPELPEENGSEEEKNGLLCKIAELERELAARDRNSAQKKELRELFPDADPDALPDSVAEQYEKGVPLAAAYALYLHIQSLERRRAEEQSRKNAHLIQGELGGNTQNVYFTADEVRAMSRDQVRINFESILDSMRHW